MVPDAAHDGNGRYRNPWGPSSQQAGFGTFLKWMLIERPRHARRGPDRPTFARRFAAATPDFPTPAAAVTDVVATWVGHATFLIQMGGRNFLTDPMWSDRASPLGWAGPRRWLAPGIAFAALPPIDAVLISHNHYDHLDDATVRRLIAREPAPRWYVPLGLRRWLVRRGAHAVTELDWWEEARWGADAAGSVPPIALTATPAQHFSGRGLADRDRTLWCGWVVRCGARAIWFVGDTGRHPAFADVGQRLGPFDAVFMPIGAYDPRWFMRPVHLDPEDAVAAYTETVAAAAGASGSGGPDPVLAGMHWGTFRLTDEPMDEPPARTGAAWHAAGRPSDRLWIPRPGETRVL